MTAVFTDFPADWGRPEWLQYRRQGIGASDVASICGLSTFGSPTAVYYEKIGVAADSDESEAMRWGRLLEAPIAAEFTERTGLHVVVPQCLVFADDAPHRRATLDGLVTESRCVDGPFTGDATVLNLACGAALGTIQIKTTRDGSWDADHGGIPDRVAIQCQYEMGVAGLAHCWLAVLHGGQRLDIYELDFDPAVYQALCSIADRFWTEHVLAENPPPADSNPATTAALKGAFGDRADGTTVVLDEQTLYYAREWLPAKAALKDAEARVELIENRLRAALGEAETGCDEVGPVVSWKAQSSGARIDTKRLKVERPDIAAEYTPPPGVTRVLRAAKALKQLAEVSS